MLVSTLAVWHLEGWLIFLKQIATELGCTFMTTTQSLDNITEVVILIKYFKITEVVSFPLERVRQTWNTDCKHVY